MLISLDHYPSSDEIEIGELLFVVSVNSANVVNDIRENLRNLIGGRMVHYERLIERGVAHALEDLDDVRTVTTNLEADGALLNP